jgi:hypothetical protein
MTLLSNQKERNEMSSNIYPIGSENNHYAGFGSMTGNY